MSTSSNRQDELAASAASVTRPSEVHFIRRAPDAGFSLDEIRLILNDRARAWPSLVDAKLAELSERRDRLDSMIEILHEVRACGCEVVESCSALPGGS